VKETISTMEKRIAALPKGAIDVVGHAHDDAERHANSHAATERSAVKVIYNTPHDLSASLLRHTDGLIVSKGVTVTLNSSVPKSLSESWETFALPLVLSQFASSAGNALLWSQLDFYPDIIYKTCQESPLITTCKTVALAYFHNRGGFPVSQHMKLSRLYGQACKDVSTALQKKEWAASDDGMLSVWMLSIYEVCQLRLSVRFSTNYPSQS
jgi:hypothetical protein